MVIQCPHCCTELELPDESVGWKVQCIYCNKKFIATEEFVKQQKEALKKKTLRIPPIKRKEEPHTIIIKRPSGTSPKASTATRGYAPKKDVCKKTSEKDIYERAARKSKALRDANGWSIEDMENKIKNGQVSVVLADDGCYDLIVNACPEDVGDKLMSRLRQDGVKSSARKPGVTVVDGVEIPDGSPFWMYVPSWIIILTFPLWIVPYLIYAMVRPLNPNYESMHDKMVRLGIEKDDDDAWSYEARERWQWTLGTGRYAEKD